MRSSLGLFLFIIVLSADPTKAVDDKDVNDEQHGDHPYILPRQSSYTVNLDARSRTTFNIQTPRYPGKYISRTQVKWNITTTCDMELYCPVFNLRPRIEKGPRKGECRDYLEVIDYANVVKYCGKELNGRRYITSGPQLNLVFKSNSKHNRKNTGFDCTISCPNHTCNCGVPVPPVVNNDKIVGGNRARENQFPWQAVMVHYGSSNNSKNSLWCGGSIVNNQWVLTAAHCTDGYEARDFQILLGAQCWSNPPPGLLRLDVAQIIQHPGYNHSTFDNDIALLKLNESIDFFHTQFRPVCLPIDSNDPIPDQDDVNATISGFGTLNSGGPLPNCLQYATVPTMTNTVCNQGYPEEITPNMICAGFIDDGGIDSCQGDSGGPMTTNATCSFFVNHAVQIGIVSWGYKCAKPGYPGVYTRVTEYIDWIHNNTDWSSGNTCPSPC